MYLVKVVNMKDTTKKTDMNSVINIKYKVEVYFPIFDTFLFSLPLRPSLILWGWIQYVATFILAVYTFRYLVESNDGFQSTMNLVIIMINYLLQSIVCMFLIMGANKKHVIFLRCAYHFFKYEVGASLLFLVISIFLRVTVGCRLWYHENLDPMSYTIFYDYQSLGWIVVGLQFYLVLLVRSLIINLGFPTSCNSMYQRLYTQLPTDDNSISNEEKLYKTKDPNYLGPITVVVDPDNEQTNDNLPTIINDNQLSKNVINDVHDQSTNDNSFKIPDHSAFLMKIVENYDQEHARKDNFVPIHKVKL